mmetsp:Transcript_126331/g.218898  ORF Transcript_126331/g.218898 Transcript_126331/m.218898 type:complete len:337 (-) Transcript_126331:5692-6702(-)
MRVLAVKPLVHVVLWTILMVLSVVAMVLASSLDRTQAHAFVKQAGTALLDASNARLGGGVPSVTATVRTAQVRSAAERGIASMVLQAAARAHAMLAMEVPSARLCAPLPTNKRVEEEQKDTAMLLPDPALAPKPAGTPIPWRQLSPRPPMRPQWQPSGCQIGTLQPTRARRMTEATTGIAVRSTAIHGKPLRIWECPPLEVSSMRHATPLAGTSACRIPSADTGMAQRVTRVRWDTVGSCVTRNVCATAMGHVIGTEPPAIASRTMSTAIGMALIVARAVALMDLRAGVLNCRVPSPELIPSCLPTPCSILLTFQLQACRLIRLSQATLCMLAVVL